MRQIVIAGNWKMNKTINESIEFAKELKNSNIQNDKIVIICAPYTSIFPMALELKDTDIKMSAQNVHYAENGTFTGEISAQMLVNAKAEYVIIGHSERRKNFGETDEIINKKIKTTLKYGLKPIICIGEVLEQRELGITTNVLKTQITEDLKDIPEQDMKNIIIAYEPIWAISTGDGAGKTATPKDANDACGFIRGIIKELYNIDVANNIQILYGGSVNPSNAKELFSMEHVDGGLVGGASMDFDSFIKVINFEG